MNHYKGWTPTQRHNSYEKTKKAIRDGVIPPSTVCERCGETEGKIMYHNEDYSDPIKYLESLCWTCHMMHHNYKRNPKSHKRYFEKVAEGFMAPPVYVHDWSKLNRFTQYESRLK